jgi:hypothetical protein
MAYSLQENNTSKTSPAVDTISNGSSCSLTGFTLHADRNPTALRTLNEFGGVPSQLNAKITNISWL